MCPPPPFLGLAFRKSMMRPKYTLWHIIYKIMTMLEKNLKYIFNIYTFVQGPLTFPQFYTNQFLHSKESTMQATKLCI